MSSESHPEIYTNTNQLLRHLQSEGAQTARQLEVAHGDIDQIGIEQIEEWLAWAIDTGLVEPDRRRQVQHHRFRAADHRTA
jgi:hypothetical protein